MSFGGCDLYLRKIIRDFVIIDGENTFNHIFAVLGADFIVSYNSEKLVEALNGYADISIVP